MKDKLDAIRRILDELETARPADEPSFRESFQLFELPEVVASVVDYLQPMLRPYEVAIYWYMFRHSIVATGDVHVRVSVRGLMEGVVTSLRAGRERKTQESMTLSYGSVQETLESLCAKGAISLAGDTNRDGTPYRVHLPEEIQACREAMAKVQEEQLPTIDPKRELDFYNIKHNRIKVFERDGYRCHYCKKQLTRFSATLDHIQPASEGGDNSFDNLATACLRCNSQRNNQPLMDYLIQNQPPTTS